MWAVLVLFEYGVVTAAQSSLTNKLMKPAIKNYFLYGLHAARLLLMIATVVIFSE